MSDKLRSVNTKFWDDPFIEDLTPSEKLLFLYLLTNPLTNLVGVYEITVKRISFDTGLNKETIEKGLERFGRVRKAYYLNNFVILPNWLKNQRLNSNMKIAVSREFEKLPKELQSNILGNGSEGFKNGSEGFRIIYESFGKYEIEIESENEDESKGKKKKFVKPILDEIKKFISDNNYSVDPNKFYNYYESNGWKVGRNSMKDWQAAITYWNSKQNSGDNSKQIKDGDF